MRGGNEMINIKTIEKGLLDSDKYVRKAAIMAARYQSHNADVIDDWWHSEDVNFKIASCFSYLGANSMLPKQKIVKVIHECAKLYGDEFASNLLLAGYKRDAILTRMYPEEEFSQYYSVKLLKKCANTIPIAAPIITKWLDSPEWYHQCLALYVLARQEAKGFVPISYIYPALENMDKAVREAGVEALRNIGPSMNFMAVKFINPLNSSSVRETLMHVCQGRKDIILPLNPNRMLRGELMAVRGLSVEEETVLKWEKGTTKERAAALYARADEPNLPYVVIERGLRDGDSLLREAALIVSRTHGYPPYHSFKPKKTVFKKCVGGVILEAEIPESAEIRGDGRDGARANRAIIKNIENDYCGEKIGIAFYDCSTEYRVGNTVEINDFDMSLEECASGFHFFENHKLAKDFYY